MDEEPVEKLARLVWAVAVVVVAVGVGVVAIVEGKGWIVVRGGAKENPPK